MVLLEHLGHLVEMVMMEVEAPPGPNGIDGSPVCKILCACDMAMLCLINRDDLETQVQPDHKVLQVIQDKMVKMVLQDLKGLPVRRYTTAY